MAQISTAQSKFGGASLLLDGTGDYLTIADSNDWDFPSDFTVELWFRTSVPSQNGTPSLREYFNGYIDEFRVTKGRGRYVANFTPPATAYVDNGPITNDVFFENNVLLLHCDGTNGSTTFTDIKGHAVVVNGNAQISTAQSSLVERVYY